MKRKILLSAKKSTINAFCILLIFLIIGLSVSFAESKSSKKFKNSKSEYTVKKIKNIYIPMIELDEADIFSVIRFLSRLSKRYDSDKVGVTILADFNKKNMQKLPKVTLSLEGKSLTLMDVIYLLCETTGFNYYIEENAVIISLPSTPEIIKPQGSIQQREKEIALTEKKLKRIIIKRVDFDDISVEAAVIFFQELSRKYGINIIFHHTIHKNDKKRLVNMVLWKKNFYHSIYFFCKSSGLNFRIAKNAIIILPRPIIKK